MRTAVQLAVAALVVVGVGCPPAEQQVRPPRRVAQAEPNQAAQIAFDKAFDLFAQNRWADAERAFADVIRQFPSSNVAGEARYRRGVCFNRLNRFEEGRAQLREFLEKHPTSPYARQATVELGLAEAKLGNRQDAEQILRPVVNELSREERREVEPALTAALQAGSATVEAIRRAAQAAAGGDMRAQEELVRLVDQQASFLDLAALYQEGNSSPAYGLVAAKMARVYYHLGDFDRAREAAQRALDAGAGGQRDAVQQVLERIALHQSVQPNKVGVILPLSGRFKNYGEAIQDGIGLAIQPRKDGIDLVTKDSKGEPDLAAQAVDELVREGAVVIIGPVGIAESAPAAVRAQELGVPMISLSRAEGITGIGPYVFRNSLTNSQQGQALARYATEVMGSKAAAVLAPDIPSGEEVTGAFWDGIEQAGGEVRGYELYPHDTTTFAPVIKRLVARSNIEERPEFRQEASKIAQAEKNPYRRRKLLEKLAGNQPPVIDFDVLLVPDYYKTVGLLAPALAVEDVITNGCDERELERIKKTTKREELKTVTMLGTAGWNSPDLVTRGGRYVMCSVFVDGFYANSAREQTRRFVADFSEQYNRKPGLLEAQGYDSARIVKDLVTRLKPRDRDEFRTQLAGVRKFPGATGETTFTADREADKPLFFLTVDKNGIAELPAVSISPAGVAAPPKSQQ